MVKKHRFINANALEVFCNLKLRFFLCPGAPVKLVIISGLVLFSSGGVLHCLTVFPSYRRTLVSTRLCSRQNCATDVTATWEQTGKNWAHSVCYKTPQPQKKTLPPQRGTVQKCFYRLCKRGPKKDWRMVWNPRDNKKNLQYKYNSTIGMF